MLLFSVQESSTADLELFCFSLFFSANVPYFRGGAITSAFMEWRWNFMFSTRVDVFGAVFGIRPEQNNGLIMYSGSANAFISLAMIDGVIQFRYG